MRLLKTIETQITNVDDIRPRDSVSATLVAVEGTYDTCFSNAVLAFFHDSVQDMNELAMLLDLLGLMGDRYQSQMVGKEVQVIVEVEKAGRGSYHCTPLAIGHRKVSKKDKKESMDDDLFVVLNSNLQLVNHEKAIEYLKNNK